MQDGWLEDFKALKKGEYVPWEIARNMKSIKACCGESGGGNDNPAIYYSNPFIIQKVTDTLGGVVPNPNMNCFHPEFITETFFTLLNK